MKTWTSWQHAEQALREVGLAEIRRERLVGKMNEKLDAIKADYADRLAGLDEDLARWQSELQTWCDTHRSEMQPASKKRDAGLVWKNTLGKLAFRKCPAAIEFTVKNVEKVLAALRAKQLTTCIRTVEEPNKDVLLGLDDATLAAVHCRKKPSEKFEVKPNYAEIERQA